MSARPQPAAPVLPLTDAQLTAANHLIDAVDTTGLAWLSGYAAGVARGRTGGDTATECITGAATTAAAPPAVVPATTITIVYGSQTGNARRIAEQLAAAAEAANLTVRLLRADAYPLRELAAERQLYLVISTQGDGDPPDNARALFEYLRGKRAPRLEQLHYAVLGLGDSSYPQFCTIGEILDARLAELGATRLLPRADADLDIETVATPWRAGVLAKAKETLKPVATITPLRPLAQTNAPAHDRAHPFAAGLLCNQRITLSAGGKDVRHLEFSLGGAGLHYQPGDALGIWPRNPQALVDELLQRLSLNGEKTVEHDGITLPLRHWLLEKREVTRLSRPFLVAHAERACDAALTQLLASNNKAHLQAMLRRDQPIDVIQRYRANWDAQALVAALRPLTPRLYSIATSRKVVADEVHLTVAHVEYTRDGATRWGAASHQLASLAEDQSAPVYIEPNEHFRLPADRGRDVIMIGPGTGVAPFRAFMQERAETRTMTTGTGGRNWLFFGNPHFHSDFLYQLEWQRALKDGSLDRIDLAFSRDGASKIYVQDRMAERARALYDWLQGGAYVYVCGAIAMGRDVHAALLDAISQHNGGDREAAAGYLDVLAQEGRYARDVY